MSARFNNNEGQSITLNNKYLAFLFSLLTICTMLVKCTSEGHALYEKIYCGIGKDNTLKIWNEYQQALYESEKLHSHIVDKNSIQPKTIILNNADLINKCRELKKEGNMDKRWVTYLDEYLRVTTQYSEWFQKVQLPKQSNETTKQLIEEGQTFSLKFSSLINQEKKLSVDLKGTYKKDFTIKHISNGIW